MPPTQESTKDNTEDFKADPRKGVILMLIVVFLQGMNWLCLKYIYICEPKINAI